MSIGNVQEFIARMLEEAGASLAKRPELLPVINRDLIRKVLGLARTLKLDELYRLCLLFQIFVAPLEMV